MKRAYTILATLVVLFVCLFLLPTEAEAAEIASGSSKYIDWVLDDRGTLTISGRGSMNDYYYFTGGPWCSKYADVIRNVVIENGVSIIGEYAFMGCTNLTSITIPDSVTSIRSGAFSKCSGLTSITIPNSVTSIGSLAFCGCSGLTSITIPNSVTSIESNTFLNCDGLLSVIIPDSVLVIGEEAFNFCDNLQSVVVGNKLSMIGSNAFRGCTKLNHVLCTGTQENWEWIIIGNGNEYLTKATRHYNCTGNEITEQGCSICIANCTHTWGSGSVTKKPTCVETGIKTYTCPVCKKTKTEVIEKSTTHTPGPDATATTDQACTVCGTVLNPATGEDPTEPVAPPADDEKPADNTTTIVIIAAVVALGGGGAAAGIVLWKKKH